MRSWSSGGVGIRILEFLRKSVFIRPRVSRSLISDHFTVTLNLKVFRQLGT